eukprot:364741-Chlamydomonas_euryale.AAC.19
MTVRVTRVADRACDTPREYPGCEESTEVRQAVPFLACGDLSAGDPDANYELDEASFVHRDPVQPPTAPAYKTAMELTRRQQQQQQQVAQAEAELTRQQS